MRLVIEHQERYPSRWSAICSIAGKIGCTPETPRSWCKQAEGAQVKSTEVQTDRKLVKRQFTATRPNQLWVADFTYVATWSCFIYVVFIVDVYARSIVGWRVSRSIETELVLDALEQALWARKNREQSIHHSDRGLTGN